MSHTETTQLITKEIYDKYHLKRVRIMRFAYIIKLSENLEYAKILVEVIPVTDGKTATNTMSYESNNYQSAGQVYRKAIELAHDIQAEIERNIPCDYLIPVIGLENQC